MKGNKYIMTTLIIYNKYMLKIHNNCKKICENMTFDNILCIIETEYKKKGSENSEKSFL